MKNYFISSLLIFLLASMLPAESANELKARIAERKASVDQILSTQLVGENQSGFLEALGNLSTKQVEIVAKENADRKSVYQLLANQTGASVEFVGKRRALQIHELAPKGTKIEKPNGEWVTK